MLGTPCLIVYEFNKVSNYNYCDDRRQRLCGSGDGSRVTYFIHSKFIMMFITLRISVIYIIEFISSNYDGLNLSTNKVKIFYYITVDVVHWKRNEYNINFYRETDNITTTDLPKCLEINRRQTTVDHNVHKTGGRGNLLDFFNLMDEIW